MQYDYYNTIVIVAYRIRADIVIYSYYGGIAKVTTKRTEIRRWRWKTRVARWVILTCVGERRFPATKARKSSAKRRSPRGGGTVSQERRPAFDQSDGERRLYIYIIAQSSIYSFRCKTEDPARDEESESRIVFSIVTCQTRKPAANTQQAAELGKCVFYQIRIIL